MPSSTGKILDELMSDPCTDYDQRPWGYMRVLDAPDHDLTVKYLRVLNGERTSLQRHERKDELLFIISGDGFVEVDGVRRTAGSIIRIPPGTVHRVTGPLEYIEVSTYDDGTDTIRLEDDYDRT